MASTSAPRRALLSLHDVTPLHLERLERAEALFRELGVRRVAYLLIPDYHGRAPADTPAFADWCRRSRPFEVEWLLHGYYHRETGSGARLGPVDWLARRYATGGEGEFADLDEPACARRLREGIAVFERVLGRRPWGFVPPAWLYSTALPAALRSEGLELWEDRHRIYRVGGDQPVGAPVITWATRTPLLKWTSVGGTPVLERLWHRSDVLRVAVHPYDFDHAATVASIRRVCRRALSNRRQVAYRTLLGESSGHDRAANDVTR